MVNYFYIFKYRLHERNGMDTMRGVEAGFTRSVQMFHLDGVQPLPSYELRPNDIYTEHYE